MTERMIHPKVCAVCGQVLDRYQGGWIHTAELVQAPNSHVAVPVEYGAVPLVTRCDFCHRTVELFQRWCVPATDFEVPLIKTVSIGGWACDKVCADLVAARDWNGLIDRHYASPETQTVDAPIYREWLEKLYAKLEEHMEEPRPFRAGDELVPETPKRPKR